MLVKAVEDSVCLPRESSAAQLSLDEELAIHDRGGGVEGRARDGWVDIVLGGGGVSNQEPDGLELVEATGISKAGQDFVYIVCGEGQYYCIIGRSGRYSRKGSGTRPSGAG